MTVSPSIADYDEADRERLFEDYAVIDSAPEPAFDDIAEFAAALCQTPIALVSLVERDRQWFKAKVGIDAEQTPRDQSFCAFAMVNNEIMVVPDAARDPRFADNPLVTGAPHIRFYAGAPLVSPEGVPLGALCVIDHAPREGLSALQHQGLTVLTAQVVSQLEARRSSQERALVAHELSHRIKNIFAVIAGLIGLSARATPALKPLADDLRHRIAALGRAHDFVRPHSARSRPHGGNSTLRGLLGELFAPYQVSDAPRVVISGDDEAVDDRAATPVALLFHELATNAAKYGALSGDGKIDVTVVTSDELCTIDWCERGGPVISSPPEPSGFGSRLIELSVGSQLKGEIRRDWRHDGLNATVEIPLASLRRST